jgi:hypothetical protein
MFRLYSHPQMYHIYKNDNMIIVEYYIIYYRILTDPLSYNNNFSMFIYVIHLRMAV